MGELVVEEGEELGGCREARSFKERMNANGDCLKERRRRDEGLREEDDDRERKDEGGESGEGLVALEEGMG